jgi:hypothetical protein
LNEPCIELHSRGGVGTSASILPLPEEARKGVDSNGFLSRLAWHSECHFFDSSLVPVWEILLLVVAFQFDTLLYIQTHEFLLKTFEEVQALYCDQLTQ